MRLEPERYELAGTPEYDGRFDRREFFERTGAGLAILLLAGEADAQESGRRGGGGRAAPREVSAWLHIGGDGHVTVFTGKVEVGQNTRTMLTLSVADELHVTPEMVVLVMGDTDRVPFDQGTFGSQSTPQMAPQLRRAAAAARQALIEMAAERWSVEKATLSAVDGEVRGGGKRIGYGELTKGQQMVRTVADGPITPASEWTAAGKSLHKVDGRAFVTGSHKYTPDIKLPGMLHGKMLRAPSIGAKLKRADVSKARAMSGVVVVQEGDFIGVAAPDVSTASKAIAAIEAEWEPLAQPGSAELFTHLEKTASPSRASAEAVDAGLRAAKTRHESRYTVAYIAHAPLEPRAAVAEWKDGKLTAWTGTQRPFGVRTELAQRFGIPETQVRVMMPDTGSGYGGKHTGEAAVEAAKLAKAAGRPVKLVWTREEEFYWAYARPAGVITVRSGIDAAGKMTAWDFHNYNSGNSGIQHKYDMPGQRIEFHQSQSPLKQGSYRGLAATANHFARESHMDELARMAAIDPLEFRLRNSSDARLRGVLEATAKAFRWSERKRSANVGFGIAAGFEKNGYIATAAEVRIEGPSREVKVVRLAAAFDCGAVVNPDHLRSQVEGALVQGLGGALFEALEFDHGVIRNARFSSYRVPRFRDLPPMEIVLVDRKDVPSAGAGETPIVCVAPAIGNAIFDAIGVRVRSMPLAPRGVVT